MSPENVYPKRFSSETRKSLKDTGYSIYRLTGMTIPDVNSELSKIRRKNHWKINLAVVMGVSGPHGENISLEDDLSLQTLRSRTQEVAINPDPNELFLPDSYGSFEKQLRLVEQHTQQVRKRLEKDDLMSTIGELTDYCELFLRHQKATGKDLFGSEYFYIDQEATESYGRRWIVYREIITATSLPLFGQISISPFLYKEELAVYVDRRVRPRESIYRPWVSPLLIPV